MFVSIWYIPLWQRLCINKLNIENVIRAFRTSERYSVFSQTAYCELWAVLLRAENSHKNRSCVYCDCWEDITMDHDTTITRKDTSGIFEENTSEAIKKVIVKRRTLFGKRLSLKKSYRERYVLILLYVLENVQ